MTPEEKVRVTERLRQSIEEDNRLTRRFEFAPQDHVIITACQVNYRGRILRCIWEGERGQLYDVQYVDDRGEFKRGEFSHDELTPLNPTR